MKRITLILLSLLLVLSPLSSLAEQDKSFFGFGDSSAWADEEDAFSLSGLFGWLEDDSTPSYGQQQEDAFGLSGLFGWLEDDASGAGTAEDFSWDSWGSSQDISSLFGWDSSNLSGLFVQEDSGNLDWLFGSSLGSGSYNTMDNASAKTWADTGDKNTTWAIYWYLCGSDLETKGGCATRDLQELMNANLPDNVTVIIQTGGARRWQNNFVKADRLQRWVYQGGDFRLVAEEENASMGNPRTLADFLDFCERNFPADHRCAILWNHGGGSVSGVAYDENYSYDSLTLSEMYTAFTAVFEPDEKQPPLAMIGFDACLMATIDVAYTFHGLAEYLVASEETEPGYGWDYEAWLKRLGQNPAMSPAMLGRIICETYAESCAAKKQQGTMTLSLTDLKQIGELVNAYEAFGVEALQAATKDSGFFNRFARAAARSENYGGNSREVGFTNMVDLGHLARLTSDMLPSAARVTNALKNCVLYQVNGSYRTEATGLSCYYSYSGNEKELNAYIEQGVGDAFAYYNLFGLSGKLPGAGQAYLQQAGAAPVAPQAPQVITSALGWDNIALTVDENGNSCLNLGPQADDILAGISFLLYYVDEENDLMMWLGTDNDMDGAWEEGVFYDNFRGVWGALNGRLVFMELTFEGDDYNLYAVPVLLNGEECHLQVVYDFNAEAWSILGARQGLEDNGMGNKNLRLLKKGDVITTLWYITSFEEDEDFTIIEKDRFVIDETLTFGEAPLPDGLYTMVYEMWDAQGNYAYSEGVVFECTDGEIFTFVD